MIDAHDTFVRSLEQAPAELIAVHQKRPSDELARMIRQLELEIADLRPGADKAPEAG